MAAVANAYPEMNPRGGRPPASPGQSRPQARRANQNAKGRTQKMRLPAFPNDDLFFEAKGIDNSMVVRAEDPNSGRSCWRVMGSIVAMSLIFTGLLLPSAYKMMAGKQMHQLVNEQTQLRREIAELLALEARHTNLQRLEVLAKNQQLIDPPMQAVQHISSKGAYALNRLPSGK